MKLKCEISIENGTKGFYPVVLEPITLETERKGSPGKLTFSCIQDKSLKIEEGNPVSFKVDGTKMFRGFIFKIKRDNSSVIQITAYDQIRYLKNKDTYVFTNTTANRIAKMICKDYGIKTGELEETSFLIKSVVYDNKTLLDMIQDAIEMTMTNTKKLYVLYDDFGKIQIRQLARMKLGLLIDADTAETFDFESSIDKDTYNRIVLEYEDDKGKTRSFWMKEDKSTQKKWGTLQYFEKISKDEKDTAKSKAKALLELYDSKTKTLTINNAIGDKRVRGGSLIMIQLTFGQEKISNFMVVDKCTHTFRENEHFMTLKLQGGEFVA